MEWGEVNERLLQIHCRGHPRCHGDDPRRIDRPDIDLASVMPFLALRSYLPADHPDKAREIGSEPDPAAFVDMLLGLTAEWRRVLAPHGSICVELGDTYSGSGGGGGDYNPGGLREGQQVFAGSASKASGAHHHEACDLDDDCSCDDFAQKMRDSNAAHWRQKNANRDGWPLAKSKALIPELYRVALAYGIIPLTGAPSPAGRWRVRNVVTWARPNPPVGALGDKYRPATSDLVVACVSDRRWFDLDAVRTPQSEPDRAHRRDLTNRGAPGYHTGDDTDPRLVQNAAGAPPLDYWVIPPGGYSGSHYAVFPPQLCRIPILSMCPREVCRVCGEPRRRIVDITRPVAANNGTRLKVDGVLSRSQDRAPEVGWQMAHETLGWTTCGHDDFRPGIVYDPFGGSGTTGVVATGNGRDCLMVDIDPRNADLARERLGMFLDVEHHQPENVA